RAALLALAEALLEAGDPTTGVEDLLLTGVEGVALGAHVGAQLALGERTPRDEVGTTSACHLGPDVLRVDVGLHVCLLCRGATAGRTSITPRRGWCVSIDCARTGAAMI